MKSKPESAEYKTFSDALSKVLRVSHSEMQSKLQTERAEKERKPKPDTPKGGK
jgi:hypothetical protein